jgi:N-methylhydantoinase B/oxoprolinase/acetone carboxylase alpha subunit
MIMVFDPQILFNDGFYDLMDVRIPEGSLLKPLSIRRRCRAARTHSAASSTSWAACSARARPSSCALRRLLRQPAPDVLGLRRAGNGE